jgi:hypothetical protein
MGNISVDGSDDKDKETSAEVVPRNMRKQGNKKVLTALVAVVIVAAFGYMLFDRMKLSKEVDKLSQSQMQQASAEDEAKQLSSEVGKLIDLPADEVPTIATVTDASKVQDKPFFAKAQNGDKVLLYAKSSKAVLYRPSAKKLIEVSALNLSEAQPSGTTPITNSNR